MGFLDKVIGQVSDTVSDIVEDAQEGDIVGVATEIVLPLGGETGDLLQEQVKTIGNAVLDGNLQDLEYDTDFAGDMAEAAIQDAVDAAEIYAELNGVPVDTDSDLLDISSDLLGGSC